MTRSAPEIRRLVCAINSNACPASSGSAANTCRVIAAIACNHSPRDCAAANNRAFSIATAAVPANAVVNSSSSALNSPRKLSAKYKFPNTSSRIRIGTPKKLFIGGCPTGNPADRGSTPIRRNRIGRGSSINAPNKPLPSGKCPIRPTTSTGIPQCTNSTNPPPGEITPNAAYRAPTNSRAASAIRRNTAGNVKSRVTVCDARNNPRNRPCVAITSCARSTN